MQCVKKQLAADQFVLVHQDILVIRWLIVDVQNVQHIQIVVAIKLVEMAIVLIHVLEFVDKMLIVK